MDNKEVLLKVKNLVVHYETHNAVVEAVNNVSFEILGGQTLGLVGETGAGKTTIALAIMSLLPKYTGKIIHGSIEFDGKDITAISNKEMRAIRGRDISMIFQDPMSSLNPVMRVDAQIAELIRLHQHVSRIDAERRAQEILKKVGIQPERAGEYPHQFSGGMKQRVVIAMALACNPKLLIADEPTTALDVTIQAQVLDLIRELNNEFGTSMLLITHDLGVVAETCDTVAVIYAGEIVEFGTLEDIFDHASHPYTKALFATIPSLYKDVERLQPITGPAVNAADLPEGCSFCDRCPQMQEICKTHDPSHVEVAPGHIVKCILAEKAGSEIPEQQLGKSNQPVKSTPESRRNEGIPCQ